MTTHRFQQDRFAIGFWVDPPADEKMAERYAQIAAANFTLALGGFGAKTEADVQRQLDLCRKHGMNALAYLPGYVSGAMHGVEQMDEVRAADRFPEHPACWGYQLRDEPNAEEFPNLRLMTDHLRQARLGKLAFVNLFPLGCFPRQALKAASYDDYVERFVREVDPDVLCVDHYPRMAPEADTRDQYCANMAILRRHALDRQIPFWTFFNTMPFGVNDDPTEAQLRWQIWTALAYGAKGVLYFCYWTPRGDEFPKGGAIIAADGRPTRHYDQARRINTELKNLGPTLMHLTSQDVYRIPPGVLPEVVLEDSPISGLSPGDYLVGVFRHRDGRTAVLLNNYSYAFTAWPTVQFAVPPQRVVEVDPMTGAEVPLHDDSPDMPGLQISLDAGVGRLFLFQER